MSEHIREEQPVVMHLAFLSTQQSSLSYSVCQVYWCRNNWVGMPSNQGDRVQSNLQFQPLISVKLTDNWNLLTRPVLQLFSSTPYLDQTGKANRVTGFGDTVFAFALSPGPALVGNWLLAAGPTFIFPTATESLLGQNKWQFGPTVAVGYLGKHFIAYVF